MHVSEWLFTLFAIKTDNEDYESDLEDEFIEMHVDLEVRALFKIANLRECWSNINTANKYPNL